MGGSGGFFVRKVDPQEIADKIRKQENKLHDQEFESEINSFINSMLVDFNDRDTEAIQKHLSEIKKALENDIEGQINLKYGGSVSKHTYIDGLSDIDSLALINKTELLNKSPEEVKDYFYSRLQERFPSTEVRKGDLAITLKFSDEKEIQILPALKTSTGYKIASTNNDGWTNIKPKIFALSLRAMNQKMSGKLIPMIKLAKSIISNLPSQRQVSGYHAEALSIECFKDYKGQKTTKSMLKFFFESSSSIVNSPIKDKTGQSTHVDEYLGSSNSLQRKMVSDSLAQIGRKIQNANASKSINQWNELFK